MNDTVNIEMRISAPVDMVWKAWTDPDLILEWFGSDPDGKGLKAKLDVSPGGAFEISFMNSNFTEHTCSGKYLEVEPFRKLIFDWTWKSEPGVVSLVSLLLVPVDMHTMIHFEHAGVGTESAHNYKDGWTSTFQKLDRLLIAPQ
jgi:uncharacterized protein YndB with AHSA1/START domain